MIALTPAGEPAILPPPENPGTLVLRFDGAVWRVGCREFSEPIVIDRRAMMLRSLLAGLGLFPAVGGCARLMTKEPKGGKSPLKQAAATPGGVSLEILFARFPLGEPELNETLWKSIDEQQLSAELRQRIASNGLRAGLLNSQLPEPLTRLLNVTDVVPDESEMKPVSQAMLQAEPIVRRRVIQLPPAGRGEILASSVLKELPLLLREEGQTRGRTYREAQGLFAVQAQADPTGYVLLSLTPEIQHGDPRQQWNGRDGIFRMEMGRPKQVFEALRIEAGLTPGQMLVLSCLPERPGSLGHYFFTDTSGASPEQKLLVIRLAEMPPEPLYVDE